MSEQTIVVVATVVTAFCLFFVYQLVRYKEGLRPSFGTDAIWLMVTLNVSMMFDIPDFSRFVRNPAMRANFLSCFLLCLS